MTFVIRIPFSTLYYYLSKNKEIPITIIKNPNIQQINHQVIELLFANSSMGLIVCDSKRQIIRVNDYIINILEYNNLDLTLKNIADIFPEDLNPSLAGEIESLSRDMTNAQMLELKIHAKKKSGPIIKVNALIKPFDDVDGLFCLVLVDPKNNGRDFKEITRSRINNTCFKDAAKDNFLCSNIKDLLEFNLILSRELSSRKKEELDLQMEIVKEKKINEFKSRFVSMASHELRTPLAGILTSVSLLEKYNVDGTPESREKHIIIIKKLVRNLTSILNDFLSLDKLEQPQVRISLKKFSVVDFINDLLKTYNVKTLSYEHIGEEENVFQDADLLKNIMNNIISNALKYSVGETPVYISSQIIQDQVVIKVKDSGIGIPEEEIANVFELFYRCENVSGIQGTGLGLNIAKLCLDLINGNINLKSEQGIGSEFVVTVPKEI